MYKKGTRRGRQYKRQYNPDNTSGLTRNQDRDSALRTYRHLTTALLALLLMVGSAIGGIIDVPADEISVQAGIDAATAGDTVLLANGVYYEKIDFHGKNITLASAFIIDGDSTHIIGTVIDADPGEVGESDSGTVVLFISGESRSCQLRGLTVQNGVGTKNLGFNVTRGGGIICSASSPTIADCIIRNNSVTAFGGGMFCHDGASPRIDNCVFEVNLADGGGAVECEDSSPEFHNCIFRNNSASLLFGVGGAIDCFNATVLFTDCLFQDNYAFAVAGAVSCYSSPVTFDNCVFIDNISYYAGAVYGYYDPVTINHCTFYGNAGRSGGGLFLETSPSILENSIIAFSREGSAIESRFEGFPTLICCDLYGNLGGDWTNFEISSQQGINGNLRTDPLFCDALELDLHIDVNSPCAAANSACGTVMGAFGPGCAGILGATLEPDPVHVYDANAVDTITVTIMIGNFTSGFSVDNVDLHSIRINDTIAPDTVKVIAAHPDFVGQILEATAPLPRLLRPYGVIWDTLQAPYTITGLFNDKSDLSLSGIWTIFGKIYGDVDGDGATDIGDLVAVVDYFFGNAPAPEHLEAVDRAGDNLVDIQDLVELVEHMFTPPDIENPSDIIRRLH